jgi:hypothetical protein
MPLRSIDAADDAELARVRLTTDHVAKATLASRYIAELGATDPGLLQRLDQDSPLDNARTLQEAADRIAGVPRLRSAIERAGLSPREYILVSLTIARAAIASAYAVAGAAQSGAPELASANVDFVGAHQKDIQRYMEAVDAMTPSGGAGASER